MCGAPGPRRHGGDEAGAEGALGAADREGEDEGQRRRPRGVEVGEDPRAAVRQGAVEGDDPTAEGRRDLFGEDQHAAHPPFADLGGVAGFQRRRGARGAQPAQRAGRQAPAIEHAKAVDFDRDPPQRGRRPARQLLDPAADRHRDRRRARPRQRLWRHAAAEGHLQAALPHGLRARTGDQEAAPDQDPVESDEAGRQNRH